MRIACPTLPLPFGALLVALLTSAGIATVSAQRSDADDRAPAATYHWNTLAPLPRPVSGQAAGVSRGALVVAGGTNFPTPLFEGGTKVWYDDIVVFDRPDGDWRTVAQLPHPRAYAATATWNDRVLVAGGSDANRHFADVWALEWIEGEIRLSHLPPLPHPVAMAGGAVLGDIFYVAGGQRAPADAEALRSVWAIDLRATDAGWRKLPPVPGAGRILPVAVSQAGQLFVLSGAALARAGSGAVVRQYLTDAWAWTPRGVPAANDRSGVIPGAWRPIADLPRATTAAPAAAVGQAHVIVFGGDDGALANRVNELGEAHPGFSRDILGYHTITDTWTSFGTLPAGLVTTVAVPHGDGVAIVGGEDRPGHRVAAVPLGRLARTTSTFVTLDYVVLALYFVPLMLIGRHFSRTNLSTEDFFLGGRGVPWWAAGLSIYATQLSAITFLAIPAKAYAEDWVFFVANLCILVVAPLVVSFYLPFYRGLHLMTVYEYLERRFDIVVRLAGSLSFVVLQLARMAIVLFLPALTLAAVSGIDVYVSILLMGILCTIYTLDGGIRAVIWTDVMQTLVLVGAAVVSVLVIVSQLEGGLSGVFDVAAAHGKLRMFNWSWSAVTASVWVVVLGNVLANLVPYTADQSVVQRYLTTRDERQAARAVRVGAWLTLPTSLLFFGVGTALYVFYRAHPASLNPAIGVDATFAWFIGQQLPAGVSGLAVAGVFAAAMSTLSSSINSITAVVVIDWHARFRPGATDGRQLRLARWLTVLVGAIGTGGALLLASANVAGLWDTFLSALGLFGGGLAGVFALGIFTRRASARSALIGLVASAIVLFLVQRYTPLHFFLYAGIGIVTCVTVGYVLSAVWPHDGRPLDGLTVHTRRRSGSTPAIVKEAQ